MNKVIATLSISALMILAAPGIASAKGGPGTTAAGVCSGSSSSKLKVKADNSKLETEFEVDSNVAGQVWKVTLNDNGTQVAKGKGTTAGPSGSFTFRRRIANLAGTDMVTANATNKATGETCMATVSL